jgi:hypothetical protein
MDTHYTTTEVRGREDSRREPSAEERRSVPMRFEMTRLGDNWGRDASLRSVVAVHQQMVTRRSTDAVLPLTCPFSIVYDHPLALARPLSLARSCSPARKRDCRA